MSVHTQTSRKSVWGKAEKKQKKQCLICLPPAPAALSLYLNFTRCGNDIGFIAAEH